jgi:hypothetical protein
VSTPVDFFLFDTSPSPVAVPGVVVTVLNSVTSVVITQGTTDSSGHVGFMLDDAIYEIRVFKSGWTSTVAQAQVDHTATTNKFNITIQNLITLPAATDPRLCRCTGRFVDFANKGQKTPVRISCVSESGFQIPKVVDGNMVFQQDMAFTTDELGVLSVDLFRNGQYWIVFGGEDDVTWNIVVPDVAAVNLIDLIHPFPVALTWDQTDAPGNAVTVPVGQTVQVHVSLTFSDYEVKTEGLDQWVIFTNSDDTIMQLGLQAVSGIIVVEGLAPGTAQVTASQVPGLLPNRIPASMLTSTPLSVTVVP